MTEGKFQSTNFDAEGKVDPKRKDVLSGSQTLSDGHTKINWNLRLVKPKGNGDPLRRAGRLWLIYWGEG
jgi:hypothetical protein